MDILKFNEFLEQQLGTINKNKSFDVIDIEPENFEEFRSQILNTKATKKVRNTGEFTIFEALGILSAKRRSRDLIAKHIDWVLNPDNTNLNSLTFKYRFVETGEVAIQLPEYKHTLGTYIGTSKEIDKIKSRKNYRYMDEHIAFLEYLYGIKPTKIYNRKNLVLVNTTVEGNPLWQPEQMILLHSGQPKYIPPKSNIYEAVRQVSPETVIEKGIQLNGSIYKVAITTLVPTEVVVKVPIKKLARVPASIDTLLLPKPYADALEKITEGVQ